MRRKLAVFSAVAVLVGLVPLDAAAQSKRTAFNTIFVELGGNAVLYSINYERITAQDVGSYKPAPAHFHRIQNVTGRSATEILHVAASLHHDIEPTRKLGIPHLWVNRREEPIPDWLAEERVLPDLRSLPELVSR